MLSSLLLPLFSLFHFLLSHLPTIISSHIYALLCLLHLGLNLPTPVPLHTTTQSLRISNRSLETHIISASPHPPTSHTRTVLIIHGLAPSAHDDPRILYLAHSVAAAQPSSLVLVPHIPPIAACDLADAPVDLIHALIHAIASNLSFTPSARLSIVSPCISAGFCLVAASRIPHAVQSILAIGTHSSVESVMHHAIQREAKDDSRYACNSVLSSFLTPRTPLRDMLVAYVFDDHYRNLGMPADELQRLLPEHPQEAKVYHRLQNDPRFLEQQLRKTYHDNEDTFLAMSPIEHLDALALESLVLVHSETDEVVPCNESVVLNDALKHRKDIRTRLCVTSLLSHGDQKAIGLRDIPAILALISAFAGFFLPDYSLTEAQCKKD